MGDVMVPAGMEEDWIRHLIELAGDPTLVTTSHGVVGMVFYAPDDVIDAFNARLRDGTPAPVWGNGAPAELNPSAESSAAPEPELEDELPGEEPEVPKRRGGRPKGSKNKTQADLQE